MATSTLKILREINNYTQDFIAEDVLGISQSSYGRIEQDPSNIKAEHAQKLADLYKVSIANLLSEATPIITFKDAVKENTQSGTNGFSQSQNVQFDETAHKTLQEQNALLIKQNAELMELVKALGGKLAGGNS